MKPIKEENIMKPIKEVEIRGIKFLVLAEISTEPNEYYPAGKSRMLIFAECRLQTFCNTIQGQNLKFQYYFESSSEMPKDFELRDYPIDDYHDDHIVGAFECEYELEEYGFTEEQVDQLILSKMPEQYREAAIAKQTSWEVEYAKLCEERKK